MLGGVRGFLASPACLAAALQRSSQLDASPPPPLTLAQPSGDPANLLFLLPGHDHGCQLCCLLSERNGAFDLSEL